MSIKEDATTLLIRLAELQQANPNLRNDYVEGPDLDGVLQIGPERLSDAVALLEENGYLDVIKTFGTAPYDFGGVMLTSRGRFEAERLGEVAAGEHVGGITSTDRRTRTADRSPAIHCRAVRTAGRFAFWLYRCRLGSRQPRSRGCKPADRGVRPSAGVNILRFRTTARDDRGGIAARTDRDAASYRKRCRP
jgi:hypothetical protein